MMDATLLFGWITALLIGIGVYAFIVNFDPLRKIIAFNLVGGGVFLLFGVIARRGAGAGWNGDPVPQALLITGLVVAFCATALTVVLLLRLFEETGTATLATDLPAREPVEDGSGASGAQASHEP